MRLFSIGSLFSKIVLLLGFCGAHAGTAPIEYGALDYNPKALCETARQTWGYLNQGALYDAKVIHGGKKFPIALNKVKATLEFICKNQLRMRNPDFIKAHFEFIPWYPDAEGARRVSANKPLLKQLPKDRILMTKYYVHLAKGSETHSATRPYALYGLPVDEQNLTIEEAETKADLLRFKFGKQAVLKGILKDKPVPVLAYLSRDDLESALLQGTVVVDFGNAKTKTFNVHRNNGIAYDRNKPPYEQQRYWYFKQVQGIKGYGKDAEHKITVDPQVTFAADLEQLGLGKLLLIQYQDVSGRRRSRMGILADTGGAFVDNLYQIDYLAGSYPGEAAFYQGVKGLPHYVAAYFMVLK